MVLIDLVFVLKLASKQVGLFREMLLSTNFVMLGGNQESVNNKCGAAKISALRLGFSNSNSSSHTHKEFSNSQMH